jgi:DNA-binding YbaB/EbfC family protein
MKMMDLMKQAQEMQAKIAEAQEKAAQIEIEGKAGGGMVTALVTAQDGLKRVKIDPSLMMGDDIEVVEDLIVAAFADAKSKVDAAVQESMSDATSGLPLPKGMKLPF